MGELERYGVQWNKLEKDKYYMISLIIVQMKLLPNRNRLIENELMVTSGEGLEGGIGWEFGADMYKLLYWLIK